MACITRWAEDHAEAVVLVPLVVMLGAVGAAYTWRPATTAGIIIFLAALIAVVGVALGSAKRALGYLRSRRESRQQALPTAGGQSAAARADDLDDQPASTTVTPPGDSA